MFRVPLLVADNLGERWGVTLGLRLHRHRKQTPPLPIWKWMHSFQAQKREKAIHSRMVLQGEAGQIAQEERSIFFYPPKEVAFCRIDGRYYNKNATRHCPHPAVQEKYGKDIVVTIYQCKKCTFVKRVKNCGMLGCNYGK